MTFVYEADHKIAFDLLDSVVRSCKGVEIDLYFTDDASPSNLGRKIVSWCNDVGVNAICLRDEKNLGYRGAVYRTVRLLKTIADQDKSYDVIVRIDTDALVIRHGLGDVLRQVCNDRFALYGVIQYMRRKDGLGLILDLIPFGLKRQFDSSGRIARSYSFSRYRPVWWWRIGFLGIFHGFRFGFVQGSCYFLGGGVPEKLKMLGYLDCFDQNRFGLITSEEDVIVSLMCRAAGVRIHEMDRSDPSWRDMNSIGDAVLSRDPALLPYVIHPLKTTREHEELREKIKRTLPFFKK